MKNYQGVRGSWMKATAAALLPLMAATLPFSVRGWAGTAVDTNANAVNVQSLKLIDVNCNDFCSNLVEASEQDAGGKWEEKDARDLATKNTSDGKGWSPSDDQFCSNHGYVTDATVQSETVSISTKKCNVTMLTTESDCKETNNRIMRCQFHNSQLIPQCLAYKAAEGAQLSDEIVLALDIAATAACGTACATSYAAPVTETICQAAGIGATAGEAYEVYKSNSGPIGKLVSGLLPVAGGVATAVNLGSGPNSGFGASYAEGNNQRKAACTAAVIFGVSAGIRAYNVNKDDKAKGDACKSVQSLASSAFGAPTDGKGGTSNGKVTGYSGVTTSGGNVTSVGSGGGNGTTSLAGGGSTVPPPLCNATNCELSGASSAAMDGGILKESGLDKLIAKPAADIAAAIRNGMTPEQAIQNAMAASGAGEAASSLGSLATVAQENASSLGVGKFQLNSGASATYASSGGGAGGSRSGGDANPFGNLFGGGAGAGGGARATASEEFGKQRVMDIFHTGTTQNLFEIVSGKVSAVAGRVGTR